MTTLFIIAVFILGYLFIALEHKIDISKAASALLTAAALQTAGILNNLAAWMDAAFKSKDVIAVVM